MNNFDHYAATRNLIKLLNAEGLQQHALNFQADTENGSTGSEILMALRFYLTGFIPNFSTHAVVLAHAEILLN
jgi:hypothetical protein